MGKNTTMSREALWLAIHEANTVEAWMQLTNEFNLYRIVLTMFFLHSRPDREYPDRLTMFPSPVWHKWDENDGDPLPGSIEKSQNRSQNTDANNNNTYYNKNLTGSTADAVEAVLPASAETGSMSIATSKPSSASPWNFCSPLRPLSPHEWQNPSGLRYFIVFKGIWHTFLSKAAN